MPSSAPDVSTEVDVGERLRAIRRLRRCTLRDGRRAIRPERELPEPGRARKIEREHRFVAADRGRARRKCLRSVRAGRASAAKGPPARRSPCTQLRNPGAKAASDAEAACTTWKSSSVSSIPGGRPVPSPTAHGDSEELFVVLHGSVQLELGGETHELEAGDSIDYRSSTPHRISNVGDDLAEVMWIISPPSY